MQTPTLADLKRLENGVGYEVHLVFGVPVIGRSDKVEQVGDAQQREQNRRRLDRFPGTGSHVSTRSSKQQHYHGVLTRDRLGCFTLLLVGFLEDVNW